MDSTDDILVGQVVKSKAGRDKGNVFIVVDIVDSSHVYIVDGNYRKLDNPKKKKVKHLTVYNTILQEYKNKIDRDVEINNAFIRKLLEPFNKSF